MAFTMARSNSGSKKARQCSSTEPAISCTRENSRIGAIMPFLLVFPKDGAAGVVDVDLARLARLLCPYHGEPRVEELAGGRLYLSSLAGVEDGTVAVPAATRRNPQTAW